MEQRGSNSQAFLARGKSRRLAEQSLTLPLFRGVDGGWATSRGSEQKQKEREGSGQ
ncbi:hypothetical protein FA13DRAFT_1730202 [Coprinellus micaceus]|uniref:Uncharacterized protein n=1 Tax=Coprinellus micaceus TaxID=71717 RepID=A0A4Y7TK37_COPMI|nr:hypothetical protein FA13DRAFT_1730202 [Coprinellus micaceus]